MNPPYRILRHLLLIAFVTLFFSGCFENRTHLTIHADGSATVESEIIISDRMVVALKEAEDADSPVQMNEQVPFTEESLRAEMGEYLEFTSITVEDQEDGSRIIRYKGEIPDILELLKKEEGPLENMQFVKLDEETGAILWDGLKQEGNMPNVGLAQTYAMAKGLFMEHKVTMPVELATTSGELSDDGKTVTWTVDLRDSAGLAKMQQMEDALAGQTAQATFPLNALTVELPEVSAASLSTGTTQAEGVTTSQMEFGESGLSAQVAGLITTRTRQIADDATVEPIQFFSLGEDSLEINVLMLWEDGKKPASYSSPILEEITTDTGVSLMPEDEPYGFAREPGETDGGIVESVTAAAPPAEAKSLAIVRGHVPVVASIESATVVVATPLDMIGEGKITDEAMQKVGAHISSIEAGNVEITVQGEAIDDVVLVKAGGERLNGSRGWSSFNDNYTYTFSFDQPVEAADTLEIFVRQSENRVQVPFQAENLPLP